MQRIELTYSDGSLLLSKVRGDSQARGTLTQRGQVLLRSETPGFGVHGLGLVMLLCAKLEREVRDV